MSENFSLLGRYPAPSSDKPETLDSRFRGNDDISAAHLIEKGRHISSLYIILAKAQRPQRSFIIADKLNNIDRHSRRFCRGHGDQRVAWMQRSGIRESCISFHSIQATMRYDPVIPECFYRGSSVLSHVARSCGNDDISAAHLIEKGRHISSLYIILAKVQKRKVRREDSCC
jgi:hypothetical protein